MEKKKINTLVNGVTTMVDGSEGCWCNIGMKGRNGAKEFQTCFLKAPGDTDEGFHFDCLGLRGGHFYPTRFFLLAMVFFGPGLNVA